MDRTNTATTTNLDAEHVLDVEMQKYAGKWVAVVRRKVVAVGDTLASVSNQAKAKGYKQPLIMRAPEPGVWILWLASRSGIPA
jgi:lipocalin